MSDQYDDHAMPIAPRPTVEEIRSILVEVVDDLAVRAGDAWRPTRSSYAAKEAEETAKELKADGVTRWGLALSEVVWKACELQYVATVEYARATAALLSPPFRMWAPSVMTRATLEAATQVYWLLDPAIRSGRQRVARFYCLRLKSSRHLEHAYADTSPPEPLTEFGKPEAYIIAEAASLGLIPCTGRSRRKQLVVGYDGEESPTYSARVEHLLGGKDGTYPILSGASHAEMWWLLGGNRGAAPSPLGLSAADNAAEAEDLALLAWQCIRALIEPMARASILLGRPALGRHVYLLGTKASRVFRL